MLNPRSKVYARLITTAAAALALCGPQSHGAVFWNESISGDLSNAQASPTPFTLSSGVNSVIGTVNGSTDVQDWLTLTDHVGSTAPRYHGEGDGLKSQDLKALNHR